MADRNGRVSSGRAGAGVSQDQLKDLAAAAGVPLDQDMIYIVMARDHAHTSRVKHAQTPALR